jgi:hypothetical protein
VCHPPDTVRHSDQVEDVIALMGNTPGLAVGKVKEDIDGGAMRPHPRGPLQSETPAMRSPG